MKIVINEPPRTKKNSMQIVKMGGHYTLIPSKQYREYEKACAKYFYGWAAEPITYPCEVKCTFYVPTRRKVDLCNLLEAAHDILVKYGGLGDDNREKDRSAEG